MPYEIREESGKFCVYNKDTGDNKGCSNSKEEAQKHMDALYAAENKKELTRHKGLLFSEQEVNYVTVSTSKGKACANCRFFCALGSGEGDGDLDNDCIIVEDDAPGAQPILPTGYCDRWEALPAPTQPQEPAPIPVVIVEPEMEVEMSLVERIWHKIQARLTPDKPDIQQSFSVFKDASGKPHWIARYTNNFKDLDNEIISEKALSDYVTRVNMGLVPKPELWDMHIPGTRHGQADEVFGVGHFVYAIGHYDDTEMGSKAAEYDAKHAKDMELSHGFTAPKWSFKDGIYEVANTFEITKLPKDVARGANPFTYFEEIKSMQLTPEREKHLRDVYGNETVDKIKAEAEKHGKALEELGIAYKDFSGVTPTPPVVEKQQDGDLVVEMLKAQGEQAEILTALVKQRQTERDESTRQLQAVLTEMQELRKTLNLGGRPVIRSEETRVADEVAKAAKTKAPNEDEARVRAREFMGLPTNGGSL